MTLVPPPPITLATRVPPSSDHAVLTLLSKAQGLPPVLLDPGGVALRDHQVNKHLVEENVGGGGGGGLGGGSNDFTASLVILLALEG
jgi:hypothetical protein